MKSKLEVRKRKPEFIRKDSNKYDFNAKWRKPRGLHNKMRLRKAGHGVCPSVGYGVPKEIKYLHKSGLQVVVVSCLNDVNGLDPKKHGILLSSTLGVRKKVELVGKLKQFRIFNLKDVEKFVTDVKDKIAKNKKERLSKKDKRSKAKIEAEKKKAEKEKKEEKKDDDKKVDKNLEKQKEFVKKTAGDEL